MTDIVERLRADDALAGHYEAPAIQREAADEIARLRTALLEARREGFLVALEMAERRCEDAARYVRLRARSGEDHTVASTYEQAGAMVRALPVPEVFRVPTGLEYRGG